MKEWNNAESKKLEPAETSKKVPRVCAKCGKVMGEVEAIGSDKSEGLCPECGESYFWKKETLTPDKYFPRLPGEEPFLPPFTNAEKPPEPSEKK